MEWTVDDIRIFCAKDHQSVSARMTKCMLRHYDDLMFKYAGLKQAYDIAHDFTNPPGSGQPGEK